ncbi:MAG TPA: FG-GAP-like repeat-containing protein, partial [Nannocystis sp.]
MAGCGDNGGAASATASAGGTSTGDSTGITASGEATGAPTSSGPTTGGSGTMTGATGTSAEPTGGPTTGTTGTEATTTDATTGDSSSGTTGDELCQGGTLCGQPAKCCPAGNECIADACLPVCESGVYCGQANDCCAMGQVCSGAQCVTPGAPCQDSYDCEPGNYCEQTLGQCLPQPDPLTCEIIPSFDTLNVTLEWAWTEHEVLSTPAVADLDGDGVPEVVVNVTNYNVNDYLIGIIVVLDGATGVEKFRIEHEPLQGQFGSQGRSTIAVGDVSGDGRPDIVYAGRQANGKSPIHAVDHTGKFLWTSHNAMNQTVTTGVQNGGVTLANFDDDEQAEVVIGAVLIDHDGLVLWNLNNNGGIVGSPPDYLGGLAAVADVTGDGYPEIVTGKQAWSVDWTPGDPPSVMVTELWNNNDGTDGWPAIADLDQNGTPEVILAASGKVRVLDGKTGKLWCGVDPTGVACEMNDALRTQPVSIPGGGRGGPPTVADFDGDGRPEIAVAGASQYVVFDLAREGEEIVKPANDPMPTPGAIYRRWSSATQDQSSNVTGSSVFDFQGDGAAEVTYNDECYARVYSGSDGKVLLQVENSSATIHEYPLVVDADADGNSEILMVATHVGACNAPGYKQRKGVYLYGDAGDGWVPTRRVWTQHTYHVTNATSAGNVPVQEADNWTTPGLNNYRQNVQGEGVFNAPDLTVELAIGLGFCPQQLELIATVRNEGALGVPAGVVVDFYEGQDASGTLLASTTTVGPLLPGGSEKVHLLVPAPAKDMTADYYV